MCGFCACSSHHSPLITHAIRPFYSLSRLNNRNWCRYRECAVAHCRRTALFRDVHDVRDGVQKNLKPMNSHSPYSVMDWQKRNYESTHVLLFLSITAVQNVYYLLCCLPHSCGHLFRPQRKPLKCRSWFWRKNKQNCTIQVAKRSSVVVKVGVENDSVATQRGCGTENWGQSNIQFTSLDWRWAITSWFLLKFSWQMRDQVLEHFGFYCIANATIKPSIPTSDVAAIVPVCASPSHINRPHIG